MDYQTRYDPDGLPSGIPSYYGLISAYIRRCRLSGLRDGDILMPADRRILKAIRAVYDASDERDQAVLIGTEKHIRMKAEERTARFTRLVYRIAHRAGYTAVLFLPDLPEQFTESESGNDESE